MIYIALGFPNWHYYCEEKLIVIYNNNKIYLLKLF